jgi:hypothetical protein
VTVCRHWDKKGARWIRICGKPMVCPDNKFEYYAYVLLLLMPAIEFHHNAKSALMEIEKYFPMKPGSIGDPDMYLGAKLKAV